VVRIGLTTAPTIGGIHRPRVDAGAAVGPRARSRSQPSAKSSAGSPTCVRPRSSARTSVRSREAAGAVRLTPARVPARSSRTIGGTRPRRRRWTRSGPGTTRLAGTATSGPQAVTRPGAVRRASRLRSSNRNPTRSGRAVAAGRRLRRWSLTRWGRGVRDRPSRRSGSGLRRSHAANGRDTARRSSRAAPGRQQRAPAGARSRQAADQLPKPAPGPRRRSVGVPPSGRRPHLPIPVVSAHGKPTPVRGIRGRPTRAGRIRGRRDDPVEGVLRRSSRGVRPTRGAWIQTPCPVGTVAARRPPPVAVPLTLVMASRRVDAGAHPTCLLRLRTRRRAEGSPARRRRPSPTRPAATPGHCPAGPVRGARLRVVTPSSRVRAMLRRPRWRRLRVRPAERDRTRHDLARRAADLRPPVPPLMATAVASIPLPSNHRSAPIRSPPLRPAVARTSGRQATGRRAATRWTAPDRAGRRPVRTAGGVVVRTVARRPALTSPVDPPERRHPVAPRRPPAPVRHWPRRTLPAAPARLLGRVARSRPLFRGRPVSTREQLVQVRPEVLLPPPLSERPPSPSTVPPDGRLRGVVRVRQESPGRTPRFRVLPAPRCRLAPAGRPLGRPGGPRRRTMPVLRRRSAGRPRRSPSAR
jgi:hypothetical protein